MFRRALFLAALTLLANLPGAAQQKPVARPSAVASTDSEKNPAARLPVMRVVLYKNGIGYFEHTARVHGTQDLRIDFTTGQLNDVLKSLTTVDTGDGRITSVRYNSTAPLGERLKSLRLPFGLQATNVEYLTALRGARIEVRSGGGSATGKTVER